MLQLVPFHRWISGRRNGLLVSSARPTAHALEDEVASTPKSTLSNWVRFGLATRVQVAAEAGGPSSSRVAPRSATHTARGCLWRRGPGLSPDRMISPFHRRMLAATGGQRWR